MTIGGVKTEGYLEQRNWEYKKGRGEFAETMPETSAEQPLQSDETERKRLSESNEKTVDYTYYTNRGSVLGLYGSAAPLPDSVTEYEVKNISASESDFIKNNIESGAAYKAKVLEESNRVYVEEKTEDGIVNGYLVDMEKIDRNSSSAIEQAAQEAWESKKEKETEGGGDISFEEALEIFRMYAEQRVKDGPPKFPIGGGELTIEEWDKLIASIEKENDAAREDLKNRIEEKDEKQTTDKTEALIRERKQQNATGPYSFLSKEPGVLSYNGVNFTYDDTGALCLGDMSNQDDVLTIYLKDGCFKLNRNNIGDLSKAISMFSPEDINRIMQAISQDAKCREKMNEIEETLLNIPEIAADKEKNEQE